MKSGKVLVVKTHSLMPKWKDANNSKANLNDACYGSAVFILRNPFNATIADWNRRSAQNILGKHNSSIAKDRHTYSVPQKLFRKLYDIPGGCQTAYLLLIANYSMKQVLTGPCLSQSSGKMSIQLAA